MEIGELQGAIAGKPTGDGKKSARPYSVRSADWSEQIDQLIKKRDEITTKIAELEDKAHRSGVPANALP
jgi:hypothetical protein